MNQFEKFLYQKKLDLIAVLIIFIGFFVSNIGDSIWIDILKVVLFITVVVMILYGGSVAESIPEPMSEEEHRKLLEEALKERKTDPMASKLKQKKKAEIYTPVKELPEVSREKAEEDFSNLVKRIFELTKSALVADAIGFYIMDPSENAFILRESIESAECTLAKSFPFGKSLADSVINNNKVVFENDIPDKSNVTPFHANPGTTVHSFLGAPVHYKENPIGLVLVDALAKGHFSEEDKRFIDNAAKIVSDGINAADRLYETAQLANTYGIFVNLNRQMASCETKDDIFDILTEHLTEYFRADRMVIASVLDEKKIRIERVIGPKDTVRPEQEIEVSEGLVGLVLRQQKSLLMKNVDTDSEEYTPRFYKKEPHGQPMSSFLAVPVGQKEKSVAVIILEAYAPAAFDNSDKEALNALAVNTALAMSRNQTLIQLEQLSVKDELTGLWNRRGLILRLEEEMSRSKRFDNKLSVVLLDIDRFSEISENFGSESAKILLREFSKFIKEEMRLVDILARIDEDRFVALLPSTTRFGARILAERIRKNISEKPFYIEGDIVKITVSGSIVEFPEMGETTEIIFDKLILGLNSVKEAGGNKIVIHSRKLEDKA